MEKIKIENLTFTYAAKNTPALSDINITLQSGEFVVLCGKSGSGKSTLLKMLKPPLAPHGETEGSIFFDGEPINSLDLRRQTKEIGFVLQNPDNQVVCDKVWHELVFGMESLSYPKRKIRSMAAEMASFFGIEDLFYKDVCDLSGGQKQLLSLASIMAMRPSVLILDEPTSQLDPIAAHDFLNAVAEINREFGVTVVLSEHRLEEALPLADRVIVLEKGRVAADGAPAEIGKTLKEKQSDMYMAMPTPMRVYCDTDGGGKCPVTVRQGRAWLSTKEVGKTEFEQKKEPKAGETAIRLDDVWFRYEKQQPDILKGLSMKVYESEFYVLLGGNGAGKTTAMSVINGLRKPYRGKVVVQKGKRIAALLQNPQSLFSRKTVYMELEDMARELCPDEEERRRRIEKTAEFCGLGGLLESHPYDLSGGEQQRTALAMALLRSPDILVLDEPTKGLDAHFKHKLAEKINALKKGGVTVIMVSHDVEFAAKYADRCGMLFDGQIVSEGSPREFFCDKYFYTTAASRMARGIIPGAVVDEDILCALGKQSKTAENESAEAFVPKPKERQEAERPKRFTPKKIIAGLVFALLFLGTEYFYFKTKSVLTGALSIVFLGICGMCLIPQKEIVKINKDKRVKNGISKRTLVSAAAVLLLVPLTIFFGMYSLGDRKYYFISLAIILETAIPFVMVFEGRKPAARELVIISVFCALTVAGRTVFAPMPQFKPVAAMVIVAGVCFGGETGFLVGAVSAFLSNFFFGQGPWTPWQMFGFGLIGLLAGMLFGRGILKVTKFQLAVFGFLSVIFVYGGIMNPASVLMYADKPNTAMFLSAYAMGLPFDMIHAVSTVFFLWFGAEPMCEKLERIKTKYGIIS